LSAERPFHGISPLLASVVEYTEWIACFQVLSSNATSFVKMRCGFVEYTVWLVLFSLITMSYEIDIILACEQDLQQLTLFPS